MEEFTFEIENDLGQKAVLTSLALIEDKEKNITYMIYTDSTVDADGIPNLFVSIVHKDEEGFRLEEVEDYEEIDLVSQEIDKIISEQMNN